VKRSNAGESCSNASVAHVVVASLASQRPESPGRTIEYPYCFETNVLAGCADAAWTSRDARIPQNRRRSAPI
jgi:hypothetical protein